MEEVDEETIDIIIELPVSMNYRLVSIELPVGMELPVGWCCYTKKIFKRNPKNNRSEKRMLEY